MNYNMAEDMKTIENEVLRVLGKQQKNVATIMDQMEFHNYITASIGVGIIAIDTETDNSLDPLTCKLMGLCLYAPGQKYAYIPINHRNPDTKERLVKQLNEVVVKEELQRIVDSGIKIIMHNGKFDYEVLKCTCGVAVEPSWDTMVATRLLNENERYGLKEQYIDKIDRTQEHYNIEKLFKSVQYADVKPEVFALYSAMDPYMTYKLYEYQLPVMENEKKIYQLFTEIEMPLVVIVAEMELCGALADVKYCQKLKDKYEAKLTEIDEGLNKEITSIKHIIDDWKQSPEGLEKQRVFPSESRVEKLSQEEYERKFPLFDPVVKLRYKSGKSYAEKLAFPVKLSSPDQLSILLYKVLDAPVVNRRKPNATGKHEIEALNAFASKAVIDYESDPEMGYMEPEELEKVRSLNNICTFLIERRKVEKLITTYLNPIPKLAEHWSDSKVRFHLNQLGARTGRFSSGGSWAFYENGNPVSIQGMNAQNQPSENHETRLIFKAEPGRVFVGGDISQQEPKLTAHISQDDSMIQVYEDGKDIYASIAQSIYHNNYEDNLEFFDKEKTQINSEGKKRRKVGKVIILATMYGMGPSSVAKKLGIGKGEAEKMLNAFYDQYPGVKKAIDSSTTSCKKYGFVEDICGRKRRLPDIQLPMFETKFIKAPTDSEKSAEQLIKAYLESRETFTKEELDVLQKQAKQHNIVIVSNEERIKKAERQSFNARIQGSAASLTKKIMVMVYKDPLIKKLGGRIVFQIHDELILDCPEENAEALKDRLQAIMESSSATVGVVLPMKCDMTIEHRWGESAMVAELKDAYEKLVNEGIENPVGVLCREFCNFPEESIRNVFENNNEILEFEW